ncbi:hypothetical protein HYH02_015089 [Chlamydomonas schloesseri]|uniref:Thioredoxin domain-containing protein n=1 Tax=Chlamydomonas schloesseri TaxID=2026947 RepID=A0A835VT96_9CHLO|nr:hypothetical protein HYH02_015089 [Chlamydomonas schloesseri]|eukprot:KAG2425038.1 hypothetical protein HYH02_015089 [Chlamydomonas schloesseri]
MPLQDVKTAADVAAAVGSGKPVVLYFWASWCEPCKHMDAVLGQLAADLPGLACLRVEAEVVDDVTLQYDVTTVPYFVFLKSGAVVERLEGADPPALTAKATALARGGQPATTSSAAAAPSAAAAAATAPAGPEDKAAVFGRISFLLSNWPVVLFMKGSGEQPRCGFSGKVVAALQKLGVSFKSVDILSDEAVRQGLKEYSNWPTYPQLYIKGELVGGCDIVMDMAASGELAALLADKMGPDYAAVSAAAVAAGSSAPASASAPAPAAGAPAPASSSAAAAAAGGAGGEGGAAAAGAVQDRIKALLSGPQPVMLFMKGSPEAPRCGFSRKVVEALQAEGVEFGSFDILSDEAVRQGLKEYSNWPTYPQLYVRGELVGGCDIVMEMKAAGELGSTVKEMFHRMDVA